MACLHFVGFKDDRVWSARRIFGDPDFYHRLWDWRARQEVVDGDVAAFASGTIADPPKDFSWDDSAQDIFAYQDENRMIVRMLFGSHLYGTETSLSDVDYKSIYLPSARDILLQRVKGTIKNQRAKAEREKNVPAEIEEETFSLQRYLGLLIEGQTVTLDMLFAPDGVILERSPIWEEIVANRSRLLTRRSSAFVGYCRQQANKYGIKGSRVAASRGASALFRDLIERHGPHAKLSECAAPIEAFATTTEHCGFMDIQTAHSHGREIRHFECCNRKVPYTVPLKVAFDMYDRLFKEYGERALSAERHEGVDWKALSHAVRVGREALELMSTGHITFPLPYRDYIRAIKCGDVSYAEVAAEIEHLLSAVEEGEQNSVLPEQADLEWVDNFVAELHLRAIEV